MAPNLRFLWLGLLILAQAGLVLGDAQIWTEAADELPSWAKGNTLQMNLSADSTQYALIPLTQKLALSEENNKKTGSITIQGILREAHQRNFNNFTDPDDVAYMTCDESDEDTYIDPNKLVNELVAQTPKAIVLFSTSKNWCSLEFMGTLDYTSIFSMVDTGEASTVRSHINETASDEIVDVTIYGNTTGLDPSDDHKSSGHSAVAMSILYSITAIITLLFVFIICTGAVRAHRYPDRYGPRRGLNGRGGQSRAKGLARAVLDTLPIVKFGDRRQPKPDPELELDTATTDGQYPAAQPATADAAADAADAASARTPRTSMAGSEVTSVAESMAENQGCSICTEDFRVGEDVRVLPCDHQYHPQCVDPWLVNVSGTCPLCRLDLRPGRTSDQSSAVSEGELPPPLSLEEHDPAGRPTGSRFSRLLDINRLRQASVEEQMEALRRLREDRISRQAAEPEEMMATLPEGDDGQHRSRLSDKLKERFKILTRSQSAGRRSSRC